MCTGPFTQEPGLNANELQRKEIHLERLYRSQPVGSIHSTTVRQNSELESDSTGHSVGTRAIRVANAMVRAGRSQPLAIAGIPRFLYVFATIGLVASTEYGIPIEIKLWDSKRTPLSHMVDVTNEFGIKVLAEHNFLNDNNIAFSPYGLMGILVALYEGVDGESSYQIQRSMQLPWNRNVMRIGFRDIHRTLKVSHFIGVVLFSKSARSVAVKIDSWES